MTAGTDTPERTTEEWTYIGKRLVPGAKPYTVASFLNAAGKELHFRKLKAGHIGGRYSVEVTRDGDAVTVHGSPTYLGASAALDGELPEVVRWSAASRAADVQASAAAVERRASERDGLSNALDTLALAYASLRNRADRAAFLAYVEVELTFRKVKP